MAESLRAELREVVAMRAALAARETEIVVQARSSGCTWAELGEDLGLSAAGARRRHLAADPIFARRPARRSFIDQYHDEMLAALRAQGVFLE